MDPLDDWAAVLTLNADDMQDAKGGLVVAVLT
jgi:hypothetical protein